MRKQRMTVASQVTIGILALVVALMVAAGLFLFGALRPFSSPRAQLISIAKSQADMKTPEAFGIATTNETTYAVVGKDKAGKTIGVIIPQKKKQVTVVNLADGVAPATLKKADTKSIVLGLYHGQPIWEVNSRKDYQIFDFKTGKLLD